MTKQEILNELLNAIFVSKEEEDSIEHIDMGYKEFVKKLKMLAEQVEGGIIINNK